MGARGKKPDNKREPIDLVPPEFKQPLPGMLKAEKDVWWRIVRSYPADHFRNQHLDLLRAYCEAAVEANRLKKQIRKDGEVIGGGLDKKKKESDGSEREEQEKGYSGVAKAHPLFGPLSAARSFMASASVKLGITRNTATKNEGNKPKQTTKKRVMFGEE